MQAITEGDLAGSRDNIGLGLGLLERLLDSGLLGGRGAPGERGALGPERGKRGRSAHNGEPGPAARPWLANSGESLLLLALCAGLWCVLRRRALLRAASAGAAAWRVRPGPMRVLGLGAWLALVRRRSLRATPAAAHRVRPGHEMVLGLRTWYKAFS